MTAVHTAVIPAAGRGTRFLPATKAQPKEMVALVDKPTIQYVVEEAVAAGLDDIAVVTAEGKEAIQEHFAPAPDLEQALERRADQEALDEVRRIAALAHFSYLLQREPLGLGHAVAVAREHVGPNPFAVLLPDDLMADHAELQRMIGLHSRTGCSVILLKRMPAEEISLYGCAEVEETPDGVVVRSVVEKPAPGEAPSDLAVLGRYVFTPEIFDAIDRVKPGAGGEIQLTDAIGLLLEDQPVYGHVFTSGRYDVGNKLGFLRATVELALQREDLGPAFRAFLEETVRG